MISTALIQQQDYHHHHHHHQHHLHNQDNESTITSISNTSLKESKTNLIVNYLPQTFQNDELKQLFEPMGQIESFKLIRDKTNGQSLCYGFVNFHNIEDAEKAVKQMNGYKVQNKKIKVSFARPSCESIKGANLYVCGIPKNWNVSDLNNYFSQCGKIITSRILQNTNGQTKGVGFIRFDQRYEADLAINKLSGELPYENAEEPIIIKYANYPAAITNKMMAALPLAAAAAAAGFYQPNKPQLIQAPTTAPTPQAFQPLPASVYNTTALCIPTAIQANEYLHQTTNSLNHIATAAAVAAAATTPSAAQTATNPLPPGTGWCIFVYNLAPDTEDNILWQLFGPFGAVQNVKVIRDQQMNKCRGYGFVTMSNYEEAVLAINHLNGFPIGSRALQVSFKTNRTTIHGF